MQGSVDEDGDGVANLTQTLTYDDEGRLETDELITYPTSGWDYLNLYEYDEDGLILEVTVDYGLDGVVDDRRHYTHEVEGAIERMIILVDYNDDATIDASEMYQDDLGERVITKINDDDYDGVDDFASYQAYDINGYTEFKEYDEDGDGEIDWTITYTYTYGSDGELLEKLTASDADSTDYERRVYNYLDSGVIDYVEVYSPQNGVESLKYISTYDWSACDLSSL